MGLLVLAVVSAVLVAATDGLLLTNNKLTLSTSSFSPLSVARSSSRTGSSILLPRSMLRPRAKTTMRMSDVDVSDVSSDVTEGEPEGETFSFESNVSRVMDIIINSLYSNKDVFIRELVSNAADACDKKRFNALTDGTSSDVNLGIRVYANREANTLTIEDNGIGMNKEEMIQNLGRIAESGTKRFTEAMEKKDKDSMNLIGQFGVGFYSGFLVANKMVVVSKGDKGEQLRFEAVGNALDQYKITADDSTPIETTGTRITLSLKDESDQYLDDVALRALLEKYSEFVPFPIELQRMVSKPEQEVDTDKPMEEDGTIPMKTVMKKVNEWMVVNNKKPLWLRPPRQVEEAEYSEFYKQTFKGTCSARFQLIPVSAPTHPYAPYTTPYSPLHPPIHPHISHHSFLIHSLRRATGSLALLRGGKRRLQGLALPPWRGTLRTHKRHVRLLCTLDAPLCKTCIY